MADRKARSVTLKLPCTATIQSLKAALEKEHSAAKLTVLQDLGNGNFLAEFEQKEQAEDILDSGIDWNEIHITCHPPKEYHTNVSLLGLPAYINDDEVIDALLPFGEIKSGVIRLKYKADHDLAGLENGNRLVRMVLSKPSIPYSLRISGEWCRIIHNNQQRVCSNCHAVEHSRRNCPEITCRKCNEKGHLSYNCPHATLPQDNNNNENNSDDNSPSTERENHADPTDTPSDSHTENLEPTEAMTTNTAEAIPTDPDNTYTEENIEDTHMNDKEETQHSGHKRTHNSDSDSDHNLRQRRSKIRPQPNLTATRQKAHRSPPNVPATFNFLQPS